MDLLDPQLDQNLCDFICGWHAFEKQNNVEIIDMALSEKTAGKAYTSRNDVLKDIENFLAMPEIKAHEVVRRKLNAHHHFLRISMGEDISFDTYFENTMGLKPLMFTYEKIQALRQRANVILERVGLKVAPDLEQKWKAMHEKLPFDKVAPFVDAAHVDFMRQINQKLNLNATFNVTYGKLPEDNPFLAWISGDGYDYVVNFNETRTTDYPPERLKTIAIHELSGHAPHFYLMRRAIDKGERLRYLGLVTVHEPVQFAAEGLASTLDVFFPDEYGADNVFAQAEEAVTRLFYAVTNNAGILVARGGNAQEAARFISTQAGIEQDLCERQMRYIQNNKPIGFGYRQIYGQAVETFTEIAGSHPDKNAFIKSVYKSFPMPDEIMAQTRRPVAEFI